MDADDLLAEYDIPSLGVGTRGKYAAPVGAGVRQTGDETKLRDIKRRCGALLESLREARGVSRHDFANRIALSEALLVAMESGDPSASLDMIIGALLELGASMEQIGGALAQRPPA